MSGKPTGAWVLVMAAVVISPPGSRAFPKPDFAVWLRMGGFRNLAESNGRQNPTAESKFHCLIIKIGVGRGFWEAALQTTPFFCRGDLAIRTGDDLVALSVPVATYVRS